MEKINGLNIVNSLALATQPQPQKKYSRNTANRSFATRAALPTTLHLAWPNGFLRERIDTVPNLRKEIQQCGIENEAASFTDKLCKAYTDFSIGKALYDTLDKLGAFDPQGSKKNLQQVAQKLDVIWQADLLSADLAKRLKAVEAIKNAPLQNPEELTWELERAFRDVLVAAKNIETEPGTAEKIYSDRRVLQILARILISPLEGLYQRNDIGPSSLVTEEHTYHGWQYNTNNSRTSGDNLGIGNNWWGQYDASKIFYSLLVNQSYNWLSVNHPISFDVKLTLERILALNWNVPMEYRIPSFDKPENYRMRIYSTMNDVIERIDSDPLYLKTPLEEIPANLRPKVREFRESLLKAERQEVEAHSNINLLEYIRNITRVIQE